MLDTNHATCAKGGCDVIVGRLLGGKIYCLKHAEEILRERELKKQLRGQKRRPQAAQ